jgi:3-isopropylmalate/(R)-2-methylmalate dehydratase small subunit
MAHASAIRAVSGRALVLRGSDIDTDRIMPARFLKAVTFDGLERHLFADDRAAARTAGTPHPLDAPGAAGATFLLTHANFGCGSSREHAPQALRRWGLKAIVAESFSPIFAGNALTMGLVCVSMDAEALEQLMSEIEASPAADVQLDLAHATLRVSGGVASPVHLTPAQQHAWLSGEWDGTGLLLADYDEVERVDERLPYLRATSRNA